VNCLEKEKKENGEKKEKKKKPLKKNVLFASIRHLPDPSI